MPSIEIRPFRRSDRDQLTDLVNAHIDAVLPCVSVSPNAVLSQLEREPGEYVVDPWVIARHPLVAVVNERIVGAVHLVRYGSDERVGPGLRDSGEIRWLVFRPGCDSDAVGDALTAASLRVFRAWSVESAFADCSLPAPGVYGVPDRWPHVAAALTRAGFITSGRVEAVLVADVAQLPQPGPAPLPGLTLRTALGPHATTLSAVLDGDVVGIYEVQGDLSVGGTLSRLVGWADVWNLGVHAEHRRKGIATWLVGQAAARLRLGRAQRLLDYATVEPPEEENGTLPFLLRIGFTELTRTQRGWERRQ